MIVKNSLLQSKMLKKQRHLPTQKVYFFTFLIFFAMSIFSYFPSSFSLTSSQKAAAYGLQEFLESSDAQVFILRGYAGTGKTTLMEGVIRFLRDNERSVLAMAPTGRAARILSNKTGVSARTIHSVVYKQLPPVLTDEGVKRRFEINSATPSDATVLIVDEASMLSDEFDADEQATFGTGRTLNDLLTFANLEENPSTKFVFIGDDAQLLPVKGKISPALSAHYLRSNFGLRVVESSLKEIMRYDNAILTAATKVREDLAARRLDNYIPTPQGEVEVVKAAGLVDTFLEYNPNVTDAADAVLIVASNEKAFEYNMAVRQHYFPLGEGSPMVGDRLMICANIYGATDSLMNGEMVEVTAIGEQIIRRHTLKATREEWNAFNSAKIKPSEIEFVGFDTAKVRLAFRKLQVRQMGGRRVDIVVLNDFLFSPHTELSGVVRRALMVDLRERITRDNPGSSKAALDAKLLEAIGSDMYFNAVPVKFGYAITCHKAQGGEWKQVFANICTFPERAKTVEQFRWVYTALTRASEQLVLGAPYVPNSYPKRNYRFQRY